jgi:hypothetical protein
MFGVPPHPFVSDRSRVPRGPQVRGYGYTHDGSVDNLFTFLSQLTFLLTEERARDLQSFLMVFDSNLAPVVGQQVTLGEGAGPEAEARVALLEERAASAFDTATECDLVAKGVLAGEARGFVRTASGLFRSDRAAEPLLDAATLRGAASAPGSRLTWTCVPPGSGVRTGIDRDRDGAFDRDELDASADPANPGSAPGACMDGIDNDGDGRTDHAEDPGCLLPGYPHENPQCDDGRDNDADGLADADDPQCEGRPWRNREHSGIALCGLGFELALVVPVLAWLRRLRRGGRPS